jgi:hypothetical protein
LFAGQLNNGRNFWLVQGKTQPSHHPQLLPSSGDSFVKLVNPQNAAMPNVKASNSLPACLFPPSFLSGRSFPLSLFIVFLHQNHPQKIRTKTPKKKTKN